MTAVTRLLPYIDSARKAREKVTVTFTGDDQDRLRSAKERMIALGVKRSNQSVFLRAALRKRAQDAGAKLDATVPPGQNIPGRCIRAPERVENLRTIPLGDLMRQRAVMRGELRNRRTGVSTKKTDVLALAAEAQALDQHIQARRQKAKEHLGM